MCARQTGGNAATAKECPGAGGGEEGGSPGAFGGNGVLPTAVLWDSGYKRCENNRVCLRLPVCAVLRQTRADTGRAHGRPPHLPGAHVVTPRSPGSPQEGVALPPLPLPFPQIHGGH